MFKAPPNTPYILEMRNGWIIIPTHLHLLNIPIHQLQTTNIMPHVFHVELSSFLCTSHATV
jgi:hypothetical protein